jgi:hypothetical protein
MNKMKSTIRYYRQIFDKTVHDLKMMVYSGDVDGVLWNCIYSKLDI